MFELPGRLASALDAIRAGTGLTLGGIAAGIALLFLLSRRGRR
jgi:hypothetical protein